MNFLKKLFSIIISIICLLSFFILVSSIIKLVQKVYITESFYTLQGLIILIVTSSIIVLTSLTFIILKLTINKSKKE